MGILRRTPDGKRSIDLAHFRYDTACLHCDGGKTLIHQALFDYYAAIRQRLSEDFVYLITRRMYAKWDIGTELLIEQGSARLHGFFHIDNSRQRLVIDFNQIACIASDITVFCDHEGDRITIESYFALGQRTTHAHPFCNFPQGDGYSNITYYPLDIFSGVNSHNARMAASGFSVYVPDMRVSIRAAKYSHIEHAGEFDVINVGGLTGDQARVFTPLNRRTNHSCNTHVYAYPFSSRGLKVLSKFATLPGGASALESFVVPSRLLFTCAYWSSSCRTHLLSSMLDGPHDVLIAGAAADVAFETFANLGFGWIGVVLEQLER